MSKSGRKKNSDRRKAEKSARKAAKKALYASYAQRGAGQNARHKDGVSIQTRFNHETTSCGNIGCKKCFFRGKELDKTKAVTT